ncbi:acyl-CoA thioesterase [Streptomyces sp. NPDC050400]|uniref:acyl-CoA thioesterase n=1 Tax=Streptomyces sp. NPDC050400 TaxID=3365610 RepID=UPI0037B1BE63
MPTEWQKSFEVRWDDVDLNGHLRNTRYLEYAATARLGFLVEAGWGPRELRGAGLAAVSLGEEVSYLREVFPLDAVTVTSRIAGLSADRARWRFEHVFTREGGERAAVVRTLGAWVDVQARRIAPPPAGLRALMDEARAADCETIGTRR